MTTRELGSIDLPAPEDAFALERGNGSCDRRRNHQHLNHPPHKVSTVTISYGSKMTCSWSCIIQLDCSNDGLTVIRQRQTTSSQKEKP
ncbi:MAG: hypothetical protein KME06_19715 [Kastovskya adunca ATA6-11-RM4]|nr:hypothetical protein [Kastovskya adunca ATA6-11-RM4]